MTNTSNTQRMMCFAGALVGWLTLIAQLYLIIENRIASVPETIVRYFSYFTILTNIMVALCFTASLIGKPPFFRKVRTQTAVAMYILVVGIVYNTVLRGLAELHGLARLADELLHLILPVFYLLYWLLYGNTAALPWKAVWPWLLYPLTYVIYSLVRGTFANFYPYPFLDVRLSGYPTVFRNSLLLTFVFLAMALLFVAITRWKNKKGLRR